MEARQTTLLGPRGPQVAALGVGTWPWGDRLYWGFGKEFSETDIFEAFQESVRAGLTLFDTAEVYARGRSEQFLGEFIRRTQASVLVATKFMPFPFRLSGSSLRRALLRSLARPGLPAVDLYQMHWPFPPVPIETWMAAMADAYDAGLIRAVGVCNYTVDHLRRAHEALARRGIVLASNQVKLSLVDRQPLHNGLQEACRELGVTLIAWGPLAKGALTGKYGPDRRPPGLRGRRYSRQFFLHHAPLFRVLGEIATSRGKTRAQVALNWCIAKGALPIPSAKTGAQARENAGALGWSLTAEEVALLDGAGAGPPG